MKRLGTQVNALVGLHDLLTDESRNDIEARSLDVFQVLGKLLPLLRVAAGAMDIAFHGDHALISINQAASLCLIANEIITNAIKHGGGTVDIAFRVNDSEAVLTVDDNGHGFPINFNPETMSNHGLEMACHLVRLDLSGSIAFETRAEGGGRVSVTMPRFAQTLNAGEHTIAYSALSAPSFQT